LTVSTAAPFDPELLNCVHASSADALVARLEADGYAVHHLAGGGITDATSFLAEANRSLPLEGGLTAHNQSAFEDAVAGGVLGLGADKVAFVWHDADVCERRDLQTFLDLVGLLLDTSRRVYDVGGRSGRSVGLFHFLLGGADNYRRIDA
jgi:hypothetical protein